MSLRSTLALHLGDLRENPKAREARLEAEFGSPRSLPNGSFRRDDAGQVWRSVRGRRKTYWERTLTLTPAKCERMLRLIGYGRWVALAYLLAWGAFYLFRLDTLSVNGMVPSYVFSEALNSIAPVFIFVFFLRFLPKTASVVHEDGTISGA